jgi:hypothetical protein
MSLAVARAIVTALTRVMLGVATQWRSAGKRIRAAQRTATT